MNHKRAIMDLKTFQGSLDNDTPPKEISRPLQALWWDAKGDWDRAHQVAQETPDPEGAWIHAYLHRKEGDEGNASYWYSRAGKPKSSKSPEEEWGQIVTEMLK